MRGTTETVATLAASLLALSGLLVACDNGGSNTVDAGVDAPMVERDSGPSEQDAGGMAEDGGGMADSGPMDAGPPDAGPTDAGPPPPSLRLAHLVVGAPAVHVCVQIPAGAGAWNLITVDSSVSPPMPRPIPYRGVSAYTNLLTLPPIAIGVAVYPESMISGGACPASPSGALINTTINGAMFMAGRFYTIAATGIPGGPGEAAPELNVVEDNLADPASAGNTRLRLYHAVPNFPPTVMGVDLCYDPDGPGSLAPEELLENASFEEVNDYVERTPLLAGALTLHAYNPAAPNCFAMPPPAGTLLATIPLPIPLPAGVPANYTPTFDADTSNTLFVVGDATIMVAARECMRDSDCAGAGPMGTFCSIPAGGSMGRCSHPNAVTVVPIDDTTGM